MSAYFCLTVRFLQPLSHARRESGEPEWPPSPLRVFQAWVSASAAHWNERQELVHAVTALRWLESLPPPTLVAAVGYSAQAPYRLYVPDNIADKVAGSWSRGGDGSIADYRTEKDVCPTYLTGEAVHYLFALSECDSPHLEILSTAARSITHLGWGVDMVAANACIMTEAEVAKLTGERWLPVQGSSGNELRAPMQGTLDALMTRHAAFLNRLCRDAKGNESFNPVPPLSVFRFVGYRNASESATPSIAAFSLLKPDASGFRSFDPTRRGMIVTAMLRNAAKQAATDAGKSEAFINSVVLGHGEKTRSAAHLPVESPRLAYIPLPSIESRGGGHEVIGGIRRVLVMVAKDDGSGQKEMGWVRQRLSGQTLLDEKNKEPQALLTLLPTNDKMVKRYTDPASTWSTVTPVVLPGYDDPKHYRRRLKDGVENAEEQKRLLLILEENIEALLRKAIEQAGFSPQLAQHAQLDWRTTGYWPGTDLASKYDVPDHLKKFPRLHVKLKWQDEHGQPLKLSGPICLGSGRYTGMGLFAAERLEGGG